MQGKQLVGGQLSGTAAPMPRATSYEDFLRHKDLTLSSSSKKMDSSAGGSSIRKAKSEPDVATHSLKKRLEVSKMIFICTVVVHCYWVVFL